MGTRTVSVLSLLALSLNATVALAAEPAAVQPYGDRDLDALDLSETYEPEAVYVTGLAARVEDGSVTGSFQILNTEETLVTGLQYRIELRGIEEEDGLPYSIDVVRTAIALAPNETKTVLLKGELPAVPAGRYELRVQLLTAKGRSLGWADTPVVVTDEDGAAQFVTLFPGTIGIASYGDELLPPLSGPNVDPGGALTLRGTAINNGGSELLVIPTVEIFDFNAARNRIATFEYAPLRIAAGEQLPLDIPLTAEVTPGVAMAHVTLRDAATGEVMSTIAQYRFVVKGEDADIVAVRMENMGTKAGDWAYGQIDLSGSADALTVTTATLRVRLTDAAGELGSIEIPGIDLTDAILTANIRIPLDRDLVGTPMVDASLLSKTAATFDHVEYAGTLSAAQLENLTNDESLQRWVAWHGVARLSVFLFVMAAVGYGLFSLAMRMKNAHGNAFTRTATAAFLLVAFALQTTSGFAAGSGGIEVLTPKNGSDVFAPLGNRPIVALFVNQPVHNQPNNFCNRQVTLDYRLEYGVCENQITNVRVLGRVARNGGLHTTYDPAGVQWETVHNREYTSGSCTQHFCFETETFTGTINLTNVVDPSANETTLQLLAKYGKNIAMPDASFNRNDTFIMLGWAHALNVHLQCTPAPVVNGCIDVLKEGFDSNGNRITTPLPGFAFTLDGNQTLQSNAQGRVTFSNVAPGQHTVTETPLAGWTQFNVTPQNGVVQVSSGNNCAAVVFKNRQEPQFGCIEILKEGYDAQGNRITTPLPNFTFTLDGNQAQQSDAQGRARFNNVPVGQHTVTETPVNGWTLFNVTPQNGVVQVSAGQNCAGVVFKNRQEPQHADLRIIKTATTQSVVRGQNAVFSIAVKNLGPATAQGVTVGDPVPAGTTFVPGASDNRCQLQGNSVFCSLGTMNPNQEITFNVAFKTNDAAGQCQTGVVTNMAAVQSDHQDPNLQNNESTATMQVTCPGAPHLTINKSGPSRVIAGGLLQYSIVVRNSGNAAADNVRVKDFFIDAAGQKIAAPFSFRSATGATVADVPACQWNATLQELDCALGTIQPNVTRTFILIFQTTGNQLCDATVSNRAEVQGTSTPTASDTHDVRPNCRGIVKTEKTGPATASVGDTITYVVRAMNWSQNDAVNPVITDIIPAGLTYVDAQSDPACNQEGNAVVCRNFPFPARATKVFNLVFTVNQNACGTTINNTATGSLLNGPSMGSQAQTTVAACPPQNADLRIIKTATSQSVVRGQNAVFSIAVKNLGPATANGVTVGDPVPAGTTFVPAASDNRCQLQGNSVFCLLGTMTANQEITFNVAFKTNESAGQCQTGTVTNRAAVQGDMQDPNLQNNESTATMQVTCPAPQFGCIEILKEGYDAGGSRLTTIPPFEFKLDNTTNVHSDNQGRARFNNVPVGQHTVTETPVNGWTLFNVTPQNGIVNVAAGQNCAGVVFKNRQEPQHADLRIIKTGPATAVRGSNLPYQLAVKNLGPATATGVVVGDPLPVGTTFVAAASDSRCQLQGNTVFCTIGFMAANQEITLNLTLATQAQQSCVPGTVTNRAAVQNDRQDPNLQNNESSVTTQLTCPAPQTADVSIVKTGTQTAQRGQNITYQLLVTNAGPLTASGVTVSDAIPAGLTLTGASLTQQPAGTTCSVTNGTITCQLGSLAPSSSRTLTFVFATQLPTGVCENGAVSNTGVVTTTTTDGNSQNNQSSATTQLTCPTQQMGCIDVIKETFDPFGNILTPVTQFTFTLDGTRTAVNNSQGRARFENVPAGQHTVTETLPNGWAQQLVTPAGGTVSVPAGTACATVTFKNKQNTFAGNEGFTISKTDGRTEAEPGDTLRYVITVRNVGLTRQTNVTVTDTLPEEVEFIDATPNESDEDGRDIRWENQTFEAGETKTYEIEVEIDDDADGETLLNTARVQDKTATDRTDVEDDDDDEDEDLEIDLRKTASTSEVFPGGIIDYTVTVENTGDETIEDLVVTDQLPADVIIIDDGDADSRSGRRLEWEIDELEEGDEATFRYRVSVPTYMVAGQIIRNDVCVEADDLDDDVCESVTTTVLGIIPRTGSTASSAPTNHLKPLTPAKPADSTIPFLAFIALAGVGTGAAAGFGRKLLIGI